MVVQVGGYALSLEFFHQATCAWHSLRCVAMTLGAAHGNV
jgi:hypothetical protein